MSWALEMAIGENTAEMKEFGIKINVESSMIITSDVAMTLQRGLSPDKYRRIIREAITREKKNKAEKIKSKQIKLF